MFDRPRGQRGLPPQVIVDDDVREWAMQYCWRVYEHGRARIPYVRRAACENGKVRVIFLHREIMGEPKNVQVDHINGNSLDNRRCNLRIVDKCGNMQNRTRQMKNNKSGVRGVTWDQTARKWKCTARVNRKYHHLGYHATLEQAADHIRKWRRENMPFSMELVP